jgi:hypothetical protein
MCALETRWQGFGAVSCDFWGSFLLCASETRWLGEEEEEEEDYLFVFNDTIVGWQFLNGS